MKRVMMLTHGELCIGFQSAYDVICGDDKAFSAIPMYPADSVETMKGKIKAELDKANPEDIIILMTDIPAGSTTQAAIPFMEEYKNLHVISGVNFALLLEIMMNPMEENPKDAIRFALQQSAQTIQYMNDLLESM